ncbi:MAG: Ig-like domain-containing protein [Archangiaceae bacterium]|nr:Ig-like domain-containing protein [Archangiaceae bacterium]
MKRLLLFASLLMGCLDFTSAKQQCFDAGWCSNGPADLPYVVSHAPRNAATAVGVNDAITLNFSRAIADSTLEVTLVPAETLSSPQWDEERLTATLSPSSPLRFAQMYSVQVRGAVAADDGQKMMPDSFSFTTRDAPDMTAPTLSSTVPANLMTTVPLGTTLLLAFSEAMDKDSVRVESNPPFDWGTPVFSQGDKNATFSQSVDAGTLSPETTYAVSVEAEDVSGNPLTGSRTIIFTTAKAPDTVKPVVLSVSPPAGSTGISPTVNPAFNFSEAMQPSTVSAFSITPDAGAVTCTFDPSGTLMTCVHPGGPFTGTASYTLKLTAAQARDATGNTLAADFTSTFTTSSVPDTAQPTIVSTTPDAGATGAAYYPTLSVTFSEPMDKAATQAAIAVTSPAMASSGTFTWDASGKTVTFNPDDPVGGYPPNTTFNWQISNTAKDLAGNPMAGSTRLLTFKVRNHQTVKVYSAAADGYVYQPSSGDPATSSGGTIAKVGDSSLGSRYRSFLFFDLAAMLPASFIELETARLWVYQRPPTGTPYPSFGELVGEHIAYGPTLTTAMFSAAAIPGHSRVLCAPPPCPPPTTFIVASSGNDGWYSPYVDAFLPEVEMTKKMLVRLRFKTKDTDGDSVSDYVTIDTSEGSFRPYLEVTYSLP